MTVLLFIAIALVAYFLGGLNGAIITSRLVYRDDIRSHGSGNPGLTNFYRTYGGRAVVLLILIDVLKAAIPVLAGGMLLAQLAAFDLLTEPAVLGRLWAGLFSMLGHAFPCLYGFRGGKCALSGGTMVLIADWQVFLIILVVFVLAIALSRYVSLGSILAGITLPVGFLILGYPGWIVALAALCGALLFARHLDNIGRLFRGEERKLSLGRGKNKGEGT